VTEVRGGRPADVDAVGGAVDDVGEEEWTRTRAWVERGLRPGEEITGAERLRGGWSSRMRRLRVRGPGGERELVLRSFVTPFFVRHAPGLLNREAGVLRLLAGTAVPAATLHAVDATGEHCDHPSLLMSSLPGGVRVDGVEVGRRSELLARQLVEVHRVSVGEGERPRGYQAWIAAERFRPPEGSRRPEVWRRAAEVIRREPPDHRPCFLHRDFHPGNVLFTGHGDSLRVSGVVDWVETSWGPADLDVAHCSTALALLHGTFEGLRFADRYASAGGVLAAEPSAHLYWRLLDALAFAANPDKVGLPWRELGRVDLTAEVLADRLERYVVELLERYG
jgi:aminoglycoside phosphotransferase (APT) family kinase protein